MYVGEHLRHELGSHAHETTNPTTGAAAASHLALHVHLQGHLGC